jgi:pSer/pThr/pTyr-binding forkhead associated (FHA) protein
MESHVIVCPKCGKENQDHYKFCLGCGSELPKDAAMAPRTFAAPTPSAGVPRPQPQPHHLAKGIAQTVGDSSGVGVTGAASATSVPSVSAMTPDAPFEDSSPTTAFQPKSMQPSTPPPVAVGAAGASSATESARPLRPTQSARGVRGSAVPRPQQSSSNPAPASARQEPVSAPAVQPAQTEPQNTSSTPVGASGGAMVSCPVCGASVIAHFKFCGSCGHAMHDSQDRHDGRSVPAAASGAPPLSYTQKTAASTESKFKQFGKLILLRPDGSEGELFSMTEPMAMIGRASGGFFTQDAYLSPRNTRMTFTANGLVVADAESLNGTYLRIDRDVPEELVDGAMFRIGQEILRFESIHAEAALPDGVERMGSPNPGFLGRVCLMVGRQTTGNSYPIPQDGIHLGRERGDIIFPDDGYVSGLHCRIHAEGGKVMLTDVGSSNGTFIRVRSERQVPSGSVLLMGQQLYRVEY